MGRGSLLSSLLSKPATVAKPEETAISGTVTASAEATAASRPRPGAFFQRISPTSELTRKTPSPKTTEEPAAAAAVPVAVVPRDASPIRAAPPVMPSRGRGFMGARLSQMRRETSQEPQMRRETSQEPQIRSQLE